VQEKPSGRGNLQNLYQKLAPDYLDCDGTDDPPACGNYVRACQAAEVGCAMYTSVTDGMSVPAKAYPGDYCPAECVGFDSFLEKETVFNSSRYENFIPKSAKKCSAAGVGCEEFTNLDEVEKGGVIREPAVRQAVVDRIRAWGIEAGLKWIGVCESPIKGPAGNVEFLACWKK
jgi:hypothetical protein